jgi:hypothetical protein
MNNCDKCSSEEKNRICILNGKYCPEMPTDWLLNDLTPKKVIDQNMRELCFYEALPSNKKAFWFKYFPMIFKKCMTPRVGHASIRSITKECADHLPERQAA